MYSCYTRLFYSYCISTVDRLPVYVHSTYVYATYVNFYVTAKLFLISTENLLHFMCGAYLVATFMFIKE